MLVVITEGLLVLTPVCDCVVRDCQRRVMLPHHHSCTQHLQGRRRMWSLVSLVVLANVVLLGTLGFGLRRSGGMAQIFQRSPAAPRSGSLVRAPPGFCRVVVCLVDVYQHSVEDTFGRVLVAPRPGCFEGANKICPVYG